MRAFLSITCSYVRTMLCGRCQPYRSSVLRFADVLPACRTILCAALLAASPIACFETLPRLATWIKNRKDKVSKDAVECALSLVPFCIKYIPRMRRFFLDKDDSFGFTSVASRTNHPEVPEAEILFGSQEGKPWLDIFDSPQR